MAIDISLRSRLDLRNEDQRWIGNGGEPLMPCRSILLKRSAFDLVTAFPNGFIPSGVTLARETATGLYVPYASSPSEVQTVTRTSTGGTTTYSWDGETTAAVSAAATLTAAVLQAAFEALDNINPGDVTVTGATGGPFTVTFGGRYVGQNVPAITVDNTSATGGTVTIAQTTQGAGSGSGGSDVMVGHLFTSTAYDRDSTANIAAALFWAGVVVRNYLPTGHGLDAAGEADVINWISYRTNVV